MHCDCCGCRKRELEGRSQREPQPQLRLKLLGAHFRSLSYCPPFAVRTCRLQVLCVAAQVVLLRDALLASDNPKSILDYRVWPPLRANLTVSVAMSFLPSLSKELYGRIVSHATDAAVAEAISQTKMHENTKDIVLGWQPLQEGAEAAASPATR